MIMWLPTSHHYYYLLFFCQILLMFWFFVFPQKESIPFAVIGSNTVVEAKGKRVRGRLYPWGIVEGSKCFLFHFIIFTVSACCTHVHVVETDPRSVVCSGECGTLWFCEAEEHANSHTHARSEGRDPGNSLRELQSSVHPEHDSHGGEGTQPQVCAPCGTR